MDRTPRESETEAQPRGTTVVRSETEDHVRIWHAALSRVRRGQLSRARQEFTGAVLAPKTLDTLAQLQERRQERVNPTRSHGICARQTFRTGSCTLYQVPRRWRSVPAVVLCSRGLCTCFHARKCEEGLHVRHHDGTSKNPTEECAALPLALLSEDLLLKVSPDTSEKLWNQLVLRSSSPCLMWSVR